MSDLISLLIARQTPADVIAAVAMELGRMQGEIDALGKRRAADRARQQARRDAEKADCHVTSRDIADVTDVTPSPSPSSSPDPSNNPTHTPGKQPRTRKGTRLAEDWQPEALDVETERMVRAWPKGSVDREMAKFRDFWAAKAGAGGVKLDWQATWRNWLRSADERIPRNATGRTGIGTARPADGFGAALREASAFYGADHAR